MIGHGVKEVIIINLVGAKIRRTCKEFADCTVGPNGVSTIT